VRFLFLLRISFSEENHRNLAIFSLSSASSWKSQMMPTHAWLPSAFSSTASPTLHLNLPMRAPTIRWPSELGAAFLLRGVASSFGASSAPDCSYIHCQGWSS
jgi:hypothetical protein